MVAVNKIPFGHSKHSPVDINDAPTNSKQHWAKDNELFPSDSPLQ